ncbi:MAG: UDP-N-acetylmuramate dehydrogenase [Cyclobacteriaceae bacterium]
MAKILENASLLPHNTMRIDAKARYFAEVTTTEDLQEILSSSAYQNMSRLVLGGGSNILFTKDFPGIVLKVSMRGMNVVKESEQNIWLKVAAGENWHELVMHCVTNDWGGIENLSLIPGTVGAAPMQNIGAYGVEIKDVVDQVEGIDLETGKPRVFSNAECEFGYRESVFKRGLREKYFISSVTLILSKINHRLNTTYGAIQETLTSLNVKSITIQAISEAVIAIRKNKLPDPAVIGNAGSFFKNPTIDQLHFNSLKVTHPTVPHYQIDNQYVKIPAGWLIEQCGWKGKRVDDVGVHPLQALVLVNYSSKKGDAILSLAKDIQHSVLEKFGIELTPEVNIV